MRRLFFNSVIVISFFIGVNYVSAQPSFPLPFIGDTAGIVDGRIITAKEYDEMIKYLITETNLANQTDPLSGDQIHQLNKEIWNRLIEGAIISNAVVKYQISATNDELMMKIENDPPQVFVRSFSDSAGVFHKPEFIQALHDPKNDTIIQTFLPMYRAEYLRAKLAEKLISEIKITDEEVWQEYLKDKPKATKAQFEKKKEKFTKQYFEQKKQEHLYKWMENEKANAKFVDMRKAEGR